MKFFIYSLSFVISIPLVGMQLTKNTLGMEKKFICTAIGKSDALDLIRKKWRMKNSPQDVVHISQGKVIIKEEVPLGKRYGTCHNYAFTKIMGIVGKAPKVLNILGQTDYYGDNYLNISNFFEFLEPSALLQPGDFVVYFRSNEEGFQEVTHTGIVAGDDCIESKWGPINGVFEHPIWYVPENFGNHCRYFRLKMSGDELLVKIQKKLQQKEIKERYDILAQQAQQELFDNIKEYEHNKDSIKASILGNAIHKSLEYDMNVHLDVPDENGVTPLMHAERIGCKTLQELFAVYQKYNE